MENSRGQSKESQDSRSRRRNEVKRECVKERRKTKKEKNNGSKKDGRGVRNLEWRERGSQVQRRGQEIGFSKILQVDPYLQKESK